MQVYLLLEQMSEEFEEAVQLGGGWTELALPSEEEAQRYFASFRRAPPDNSALVPGTQVGSSGHIHCMHASGCASCSPSRSVKPSLPSLAASLIIVTVLYHLSKARD